MDKAYNHKEIEEKIYRNWEESGSFKPEVNPNGKPFSIVLPPPNVTGNLHIGHALMLTIEDILVRYHRMKGEKTLWLPGTDHAAIATQSKVEEKIYKRENKTRHDLGREEFLKRVEDFAKESHDHIVMQIRRIGASVDWSREAYTLDQQRNLAVRTAFKKMYDAGLIYRGETIVNWDPKLQTTVSDDEIEWREETTKLYFLQYGPFVIATARPETKFGDKYVVMHPSDKRYENYNEGQKIEVEWINGKVTAIVIKDDVIDMEFGTGVMTITPSHDKTDYEIAKRHNLDFEQIIDFNAKLLPVAGDLEGLHIKKARALVIEKLKEKGLLVKVEENYSHKLATNYRGNGIIEPQIKKQWMISVDKEFVLEYSEIEGIDSGTKTTLKKLMSHTVETKQIKIIPSRFSKTYFHHWIDNLHDWVISRQIWYGHRIPVWYCEENQKAKIINQKCLEPIISIEIVSACPNCGGKAVQDPDTLDTWFSSGLWTFSTLGWPNETEDLRQFHPTSVLETGYDILFFWVARMILMTSVCVGQVPFRTVLLHGLVRDAQKQKMSKTKGNVIDPVDLIDRYGADALRMALIFSTATGNDIPMSEDKVRGMMHFSNKLWNIGRFILDFKPDKYNDFISEKDREIIDKSEKLTEEISDLLDKYRFHDAAQRLYDFTWHEFADVYIEEAKTRREESQLALETIYLALLKLLHPFMPYVTEEIFGKLSGNTRLLITQTWPSISEASKQ
jgi:valyl-tRNA synthetase